MIIKQPRRKWFLKIGSKGFSRRTITRIVFIAVVLLTSLFFFYKFSVSKLNSVGYTGVGNFISIVIPNYLKGLGSEPEKIVVDMEHIHFQKLAFYREQALQRGLIINDTGSYVPAIIHYKGKKIDVKMRLKGHMTDHIQGDKWSYRVKVTGKGSFDGMRLFSLQHPGTRGYIYEWIYHRLLKREGIIALRYSFAELTLNGKDFGIYAVEENFDEELLENNERPAGPLMRFNPNLYWVDRFNEIQQDRIVAEYSEYLSANLEAYRTSKILNDSANAKKFIIAQVLMEKFRKGELPADRVFDIKLMAKFHAIIDLVGGLHSLDWSDVKFYYNTVTGLLEPVGYESFTATMVKTISGSHRYHEQDDPILNSSYHHRLFSNELFFREYIKQLEKISEQEYLDSFFAAEKNGLDSALGILYKEFPYKNFKPLLYYRNQERVKKIINPPKSFQVFIQNQNNDSLELKIGMIESLPVEITAVKVEGSFIKLSEPVILSSKSKEQNVKYITLSVPNLQKIASSSEVKVIYTILGSSVLKETVAFNYPLEDNLIIKNNKGAGLSQFNFIYINESEKIITIKTGKWKLMQPLIIPGGYRLKAFPGTEIDIVNSSFIMCYSSVSFNGDEENPIIIKSSDSTGKGIMILAEGENSIFKNVTFTGLSAVENAGLEAVVLVYDGNVNFESCLFQNNLNGDFIKLIRAGFQLNNCLFENCVKDALNVEFSRGRMNGVSFKNTGEDAIEVSSSNLVVKNLKINLVAEMAIDAKSNSEVTITGGSIDNAYVACSSRDLSTINLNSVSIVGSKIGLIAYQNKPGFGPAVINATSVKINNTENKVLKEKESVITLNGKPENKNTKNINSYFVKK